MLKIRHIQEIKVLLVYAIDLVGFKGWRLESLIYLEYICRDVMLMLTYENTFEYVLNIYL